MILYKALADGRVSVTEKCIYNADSCDPCGKCNYQCYFLNEMRPTKVMEALKNQVEILVKAEEKLKLPEKMISYLKFNS